MKTLKITLALGALLAAAACKKEAVINGGNGLEDWTEATHGYNASPNYDMVFSQTEVKRLDFVIEPEYWQAMQDDLESIYGGSTGGGPGGPGGPGGGGGFSDATPMYIPVQMFFEGKQWYDVGLRYKGNSSLSFAYQNGIGKLPLRIETNHFENENPNINGQSFYGFKQLSLSSNFKDNSYLHEKVAADVFRDFGVPAPMTAFYRVYVDYGEGPIYFGLYTMVEVVFDSPMLNRTFGNASGNCYKPDANGAYLNSTSLSAFNDTEFPIKSGTDYSYSDARDLISALISDTRTSDPAAWRNELEKHIDMELYLKYLAANTTIQNWDTYGRMTHNYYLYNNPNTDKLVWIPWDNNEAFAETGGMSGPLEFNFSSLSSTPTGTQGDVAWPLIEYIYDDPVYKAQYDEYIDEFIYSTYDVSELTNTFTTYHNLISPYVIGADGEIAGYTHINNASDFTNSLNVLITSINNRWTEADNYTP
ncbi:MAG: CotH kinase family protein [Fluviicola sp.]